jgi:hypothetical protein
MDRIVREAIEIIEIEFHPNSMNREVCLVSASNGSLSSSPSRNLQNLTPDPLRFTGHAQPEATAASYCVYVRSVALVL